MPSSEIQYANLQFDADHTPESLRHGDIYFTRGQGKSESEYVFLHQNGFPERWQRQQHSFCVAETGFGTGLNFFLTANSFLEHAPANTQLHFISFELFPLSPQDFRRASQAWPEYQALVEEIISHYPQPIAGLHRLQIHPRITLDLVFGDVTQTAPDWAKLNKNSVDAWFLDGFAPSKNPDMWQPTLFSALYNSMKTNGTFATFTAQGNVRRGLTSAGLAVKKASGFGHKRDMLVGRKMSLALPAPKLPTHIMIVGGGIAAASLLYKLKTFQGKITWVYDSLASGASGNAQASIYPALQAQWNYFSEFYAHAFCFAKRFYEPWQNTLVHWPGVHLKTRSAEDAERLQKVLSNPMYPSTLIDRGKYGALIPQAGWGKPPELVHALVEHALSYRTQHHLKTAQLSDTRLASLSFINRGVKCNLHNLETSLEVDHLILAAGAQLTEIIANLPIRPVQGQVTQLAWRTPPAATPELSAQVFCQKGYATPPANGAFCIGATFRKGITDLRVTDEENLENIQQFNAMTGANVEPEDIISARSSIRATTPDHLPMVGKLRGLPVSVLGGLGARGFTSAPFCAEIIVSELLQKPLPCMQKLYTRLSPNRFNPSSPDD
ncbi:MAG: tRNA 5-methylaminomethyl-2-thiouridine biosynthesis bifunctional protein MnmC [Idiomarinaceae bacterium HL-53]|nr:MAG: tRNA 5-methylaminomethyl-2-thiouridine biosynthesis bifunctional protein MnmC [Idiomarinaceae bacterium HL-53]CUS49409.1 tRNA 5-methylaminomethyl-2-thiouridine biosynthesis bifunctional protein [Idiomarinaceae bacterium HL-53]